MHKTPLTRVASLSFLTASFLMVSLLWGCGQSVEKKPEHGVRLALKVELKDLFRALAGAASDPEFESALQSMSSVEEDKKVFSERFFEALKAAYKASGRPKQENFLLPYFMTRASGLTARMTDDEVLKYLNGRVLAVLDNTFEVLRNRLDYSESPMPNLRREDEKETMYIDLPGMQDLNRARALFVKTGQLGFWETRSYESIYPLIQRLNSASQRVLGVDSIPSAPVAIETAAIPPTASNEKSALDSLFSDVNAAIDSQKVTIDPLAEEKFRAANPFLGMFNLMTPMDPARPVVGYARTTDTARINNFLAHPEAIAITPTDVRFLWEIYPDRHMVVQPTNGEPPLLGLIAIKTNRENRPPLSGQSITHARQDFDSYNNSPIINIEMNAEGALIWERLTRSNIGKCIAIVLDDHVYSYPTVQGAITGGRSQISGQFTVEEARDLAVVLRAGALPIKLTVIEATVY